MNKLEAENKKLKTKIKSLEKLVESLEIEIEEKDQVGDYESMCQLLEKESMEKSKEIKFL